MEESIRFQGASDGLQTVIIPREPNILSAKEPNASQENEAVILRAHAPRMNREASYLPPPAPTGPRVYITDPTPVARDKAVFSVPQNPRRRRAAKGYTATERTSSTESARSKRRTRLTAFSIVLVVAVTLFAGESIIKGLTLASAGLHLPDAASILLTDTNHEADTEPATVVETTQKAAEVEVIPPAALSKTDDLTETPADVALNMENYAEAHPNQKKGGKIVSITYTSKHATAHYGSLLFKNTTKTQQNIDYEDVFAQELPIKIEDGKPAVLIYHTHTTEGYELTERDWWAEGWSSRTEQAALSVVRVGTAITQQLEAAGFTVIHDTAIYDKNYNGAYDRSRVMVEKMLEEHPGLIVTLDVHRDAIHNDNGSRYKPVNTINGKKAAQVMIITGVQEGSVTDFPNWRQNLGFAMHLQNQVDTDFPGLMRPIYFCARKYNMNKTPCSLLLEFGSDNNTLEEAVYSGAMIGRSLSTLLAAYK
ncbi:MAG: stage II sporulation protein P [Oscillospiraceae bacterium]|jgi:stage II sporulation protein P|nr:stage II sporulation protein P [Oscillospiraceae bacterium]